MSLSKTFYPLLCTDFSGLFLNSGDSSRLSDLYSVYLKTIDHLNLKLLIFVGILQVLRFNFKKFRILENLNFHPCDLTQEDVSDFTEKLLNWT